MAPEPVASQDFPDAPENEADFWEDLKAFHEDRGTILDSDAKVHNRPIDLWQLFKNIEGRGGYDKVCSVKLLWREVAAEFNLPAANAAAYAFALKQVYYRNLAAYAIKRVHKQEPPPKEILELTSAKGGDLLHRTVENFQGVSVHDQQVNGQDDEDVNEDKTPKADKMDLDDPASTGRSGRGLRQAPQQRQIFQPDVSSSRQSRHASSHAQSPQPINQSQALNHNNNPALNPNSSSFNVQHYEPRLPVSLTLRSVLTPSSDPLAFKDRTKRERERELEKMGRASPRPQTMAPGTGCGGPNIYVRTLLALRSGIEGEVENALHHLVKISHERGDKYKFEAFPGLAEGLVDQLLLATSLVYDVKWEINYDEFRTDLGIEVLNGHTGTPDILDRLKQLKMHPLPGEVMDASFSHKLSKYNEAALVLRNMCMMDDNATYLSDLPAVKDMLAILLNLPKKVYFIEMKHYALDVCEQLTKNWSMTADDPLYLTLVNILGELSDRGASLASMRAITRISMNLDVQMTIKNIPLETMSTIFDWTMLDDEDLVGACLDFVYQYTAVPENIAILLLGMEHGEINLRHFLEQLGRLLEYKTTVYKEYTITADRIPAKTTKEIQEAPKDLMNQVLGLPEPERSSAWLRSLFEEDAESDITQIALWHAYQGTFSPHSTMERPLLPAAEFIKNVSTTLASANAQVIQGPQPRFIIKGIRPRAIPTDLKGKPYAMCLWTAPGSREHCGSFHSPAESMWEHILIQHLDFTKSESGQWDLDKVRAKAAETNETFFCRWATCQHFHPDGEKDAILVARHVTTHLPDTSPGAEHRAKHNRVKRPPNGPGGYPILDEDDYNEYPAEYETHKWYDTQVDDRGDATGLSLTSCYVMRNIVRNIPRAMDTPKGDLLGLKRAGGEDGWVLKLFGTLRKKFFHVAANNRVLGGYVLDLLDVVDDITKEK